MTQDGMIEAAFYSAFGARLRVIRESRHMSQQALAAEIGVHRNTIMRWEQGESPVGLLKLLRLADMLSITHERLLPPRGLTWGDVKAYSRERDPLGRKSVQTERDPVLRREEIA